ncbi:MAG: hypothetical protein J6R86_08455 [Lentisphaeria bacterium]|nr:hypothetical protein [Lentisphaeria bacterium]
MKKFLGVSELLERDVPQKLDATVLAQAAIAARRRKSLKRFRIAAGVAAMFCFGAGITLTMLPEKDVRSELSQAELLAMNDFSTLEQENYAIGIMSNPEELTFDNYI